MLSEVGTQCKGHASRRTTALQLSASSTFGLRSSRQSKTTLSFTDKTRPLIKASTALLAASPWRNAFSQLKNNGTRQENSQRSSYYTQTSAHSQA
jgi:hypothetical protein